MSEEEIEEENKRKLTYRIEHRGGIIEEHYTLELTEEQRRAGTTEENHKCFTGPGGGVVWTLSDGVASVMPPEVVPPQRVCFLMEVAAKHMPATPLEIRDVANFKGEALVLLEALRMGEAQFFRDIANAMKPPPSLVKSMAISTKENSRCDEVLQSIADTAGRLQAKPAFHAILNEYRTWPGKKKEKDTDFRKKLIQRGFGWLC